MNFTNRVKDELLSINTGYEYFGFVATKRVPLIFFNRAVGRYFYNSIKSVSNAKIESLGKSYRISYSDVKEPALSSKEERLQYLRGCFLSTGYVSNPFKEHSLDIFFYDKANAEFCLKILESLGLDSSVYKYRDKFRVSLRSAEQIMNFILMIGANNSFFDYEDILIIKSLKESSIRDMNLELANDERKAISTSKQLSIIKKLEESGV